MTPQAALARILKIVGGATALAAELGIDRNAVHAWMQRGVPEKQLGPVRKIAKRHLRQNSRIPTRRELRPDLYPKPRGAGRGNANGEKRGKKKTIICKVEEGRIVRAQEAEPEGGVGKAGSGS